MSSDQSPPRSIPQFLDQVADSYSSRIAIKCPRENLTLSFRQLHSVITKLTEYINNLPQSGNDYAPIMLIGSGSYRMLLAFLAITSSGRVAVLVDPQLHINEIKEMAHRTGVVMAWAESNSLISALDQVGIPCLDLRDMPITVSDDASENNTADEEGTASRWPNALPQSSSMALMVFTSGTSGRSKCVQLSHENLISNALASVPVVGRITEGASIMPVLPLYHLLGLNTTILTALLGGGTIIWGDGPRHFLRDLRALQPTHLVLVPMVVTAIYRGILTEIERRGRTTTVKRLLALSRVLLRCRIDLRRVFFRSVLSGLGGKLHTIVCGGAYLDAEYVTKFAEFGIQVLVGYGITECSPVVSANRPGRSRLDTVGAPIDGTEVTIIDGEVCVRGQSVMMGYDNPADTRAAFTDEGWFRTGDKGEMDADGFITLKGRLKSVIILSDGNNVDPELVEQALLDETIVESVLVRSYHNGRSEGLVALIHPIDTASESMEPSELLAACEAVVTAYNATAPNYRQILKVELSLTPFERTRLGKTKRYLYADQPTAEESL